MTDPTPLTLEDSRAIARRAIDALLAASSPETAEVDGKAVTFTAERSAQRLGVQASWEGGFARFAVIGGDGSVERRSTPEDKGHKYSLGVVSELGQREVAWVCLEWLVRDAIRTNERAFDVSFSNSLSMRDRDEAGNLKNAAYGARSRALARASGLTGQKREHVGTYDLIKNEWSPTPTETLQRLLTLCTIKVHFYDRGEGRLISGNPLFSIAGAAAPGTSSPVAPPTNAGLAGVHQWYGGVRTQLEGLLELLEHIQENEPPESEVEAWVTEQGTLKPGRYTAVLARLPINLGLAEVIDGRWQLTDLGLSLLESRDGLAGYRIFNATYIGFDETLAYLSAHPGARADAVHEYLNQVLEVNWKSTAQAMRRANWLVSFGLAESNRGSFRLTAEGVELANELPAALIERANEVPKTAEVEDEIEEQGSPVLVSEQVEVPDLVLPEGLLQQCCAALNAGKHLMLLGPPGTGKSTIGQALGQLAAEVYGLGPPLLATASADWTTYDTIGGWTQRSDQMLTFREGVVTRALKEKRWLILDEVNRADIDKSFGELFTVLAGGTVTTAYTQLEHDREVPVKIGPDASPYNLGPWFRIVATMNVRDKASLFRLSYAFIRRFAVITVPGLDDPQLAQLARREGKAMELSDDVVETAVRAFSIEHGLSKFVELGPSMLRDVLSYTAHRSVGALRAVAEGFELFILPQLEGLEDAAATDVHALLGDLFAADADVAAMLQARFRVNYPHVFR
ncbi:MAG: AAA family ATPase [Sandaracinaceae bacterium]